MRNWVMLPWLLCDFPDFVSRPTNYGTDHFRVYKDPQGKVDWTPTPIAVLGMAVGSRGEHWLTFFVYFVYLRSTADCLAPCLILNLWQDITLFSSLLFKQRHLSSDGLFEDWIGDQSKYYLPPLNKNKELLFLNWIFSSLGPIYVKK